MTTNVHQDVYKEKSTSLASSNQTCPPNNASMISRPTYARTADTDDMMKQAQRISEDHGGDIEHYFVSSQPAERSSNSLQIGRTKRSRETFEASILSTTAWKCDAENDSKAHVDHGVDYSNHMHLQVCA